MMKRNILSIVTACVLCAVCAVCMPMAAMAEEVTDSMHTFSKVFSLNMTETEGSITATPNSAAFWEYPLLKAGENFHVEGTLVVRNDGAIPASMMMEPVALPYGDEAKLAYLDNVMLTVKEGDTVLFDNSYAHINDAEGGLSLIFNDMAPGETHTYTITMRCLYTYSGDVYADATPMSWRFSAKAQTVADQGVTVVPMWLVIVAATAAVIVIGVVAAVVVNAVMKASAKKAQKPVDNSDEL